MFDISLEEAHSEMSEKDPRLLVVLDMLEDRKTVPDIMKKLNVLQSKTYQLIAKTKQIIRIIINHLCGAKTLYLSSASLLLLIYQNRILDP